MFFLREKHLQKSPRRKKNKKRGELYRKRLAVESLEERQLLAADVMTFDAGTTTSTSHSEVGMTASPLDIGDIVSIQNIDSDTDEELRVDSKSYGPMEFTLDTNLSFTLLSIDIEFFKDDRFPVVLESSSGATASFSTIGQHTFSGSGWTNITSFTITNGANAYIDNVSFGVGTFAIDDFTETNEDVAVAVDVLANDVSQVGGTLAIDSVSTPNFGTTTIDDNSTPGITDDDKIIYTPGADDYGTATFEYTISDGLGNSSTATVTVEVIPINDAPIVDLNGADDLGIDFATYFVGGAGPVEIVDDDLTLTDSDGGVTGAVVAGSGDIYVVNIDGRVTKINPDTGVQTLVSNGNLITTARNLAIDDATGDIYVVDGRSKGGSTVVKVDPNTGTETVVAGKLHGAWGIEVDTDGSLIVSDTRRSRISTNVDVVRINPVTGTTFVIESIRTGSGRSSEAAYGVALEASGDILVATGRNVYRVDPSGASSASPLPFGFIRATDVAVDQNGDILVVDVGASQITRFDPVTNVHTPLPALSIDTRWAIDINADGNIVATNRQVNAPKGLDPNRVTVIDSSSAAETVLSSGGLLKDTYGIDISAEGVLSGVDNIASATITIENLLDVNEEFLAVDTTGTNIVASYDPTTGVLSLVGDDIVANYQDVLRTATYNNTAASPNTTTRTISFVAYDGLDTSNPPAFATVVLNRPPTVDDQSFEVAENETLVGTVVATDPDLPDDTLEYSISGGADAGLFSIDSTTGELIFLNAPDYETPQDADQDNVFELIVTVSDSQSASDSANVTVNVLNLASISGVVFVDVNGNGEYDANEPGIDGVNIELRDENGDAVLDAHGAAITAITSDGGFYLFEDLDPNEYQLHEGALTGVDDGVELLGSLGGSVVSNDVMQLSLVREDAYDYAFAELGQQVAAGDTATIGFWQNKHGQALISQGGSDLASWLTSSFGNVFGDSLAGASGEDVADFYRAELFKQKGKKSAAGPAKVDAQFMAVALATYFTSSNLAGSVASGYGFNVTDTGIGTKIVNVGSAGAAFNVADGTDLTIMQLLLATHSLTDQPNDVDGFAFIYDQNGDGDIDGNEALLRSLANEIYTDINEGGDI